MDIKRFKKIIPSWAYAWAIQIIVCTALCPGIILIFARYAEGRLGMGIRLAQISALILAAVTPVAASRAGVNRYLSFITPTVCAALSMLPLGVYISAGELLSGPVIGVVSANIGAEWRKRSGSKL